MAKEEIAVATYYSINEYTSDGAQRSFELSFAGGYISKDHVKAVIILGGGLPASWPFTWVNDFTILFDRPAPAGYLIRIYRETPNILPLADFTDGAIVTERNLDVNSRQAVFLAAESADKSTLEGDFALTTPIGSHITTSGFVYVTPDGNAVTLPYLPTIIGAGTDVLDDGNWPGNTNSDGVWG
jgi:hypothetical protein